MSSTVGSGCTWVAAAKIPSGSPKSCMLFVPFAPATEQKMDTDTYTVDQELMQKHGPAIWGRLPGSNRDHLLVAGAEGVDENMYPRDLHFDSEEDRAV